MELLRRIWYLLNRRRLEREMADEMAYHRELMAVDRQREFGNDLRLLENAREVWGWTWLDRLFQDLTYGSRVLRRSPGFTVTAVLVLALGIGVPLTACRQLLYDMQANGAPDPDTLVQLTRRGTGLHITVLPYPAFAFYASNAQSFLEVIAISRPYQAVFGYTEAYQAPEQIRVLQQRTISPNTASLPRAAGSSHQPTSGWTRSRWPYWASHSGNGDLVATLRLLDRQSS